MCYLLSTEQIGDDPGESEEGQGDDGGSDQGDGQAVKGRGGGGFIHTGTDAGEDDMARR